MTTMYLASIIEQIPAIMNVAYSVALYTPLYIQAQVGSNPINVFLGDDINLLLPIHPFAPHLSQIIVAGIVKQLWNYFVENFLPRGRQEYSSQLEGTPENEEIKRPNKAQFQKKEITLKIIKEELSARSLKKTDGENMPQ